MITLTFVEAGRPRVVTPPGWTLLASQFVPPGGREAVEIRQMAGGRDESLEAQATGEGARLAEQLPAYVEESLERRPTRAGDVLVRTYGWELDGRQQRAIQIMGPGGALATLPEGEAGSDDALAAVAEAVAAFAFGAPQGSSGAYSVEELTALAELAGASSFPGTGDHAFASEEDRQAARRALLARGTLRGGPDGALAIDPLEERTVGTALSPEGIVSIAVTRPDGVERCLVYTGNRISVAHSAGAHGVHRLEAVPAALLGGLVRALTRPGTEYPAPGEAKTVSAEELSALSRTGSSTVVETEGEALSWLETDGGLSLIDADGGTATLSPASRTQIGELLDSLCAPLSARGAAS